LCFRKHRKPGAASSGNWSYGNIILNPFSPIRFLMVTFSN
jgi:hypothetical protein